MRKARAVLVLTSNLSTAVLQLMFRIYVATQIYVSINTSIHTKRATNQIFSASFFITCNEFKLSFPTYISKPPPESRLVGFRFIFLGPRISAQLIIEK